MIVKRKRTSKLTDNSHRPSLALAEGTKVVGGTCAWLPDRPLGRVRVLEVDPESGGGPGGGKGTCCRLTSFFVGFDSCGSAVGDAEMAVE